MRDCPQSPSASNLSKNPIIPWAKPQSYANPQIRSLSNQKSPPSLDEIIEKMSPHLIEMFRKSIGEQPSSDLIQLGQLLIDYEDVFVKLKLDLGCLSEVKHVTDTGDAGNEKNPIGIRVRGEGSFRKIARFRSNCTLQF